jgi:histone arginine demethylase JMJD6
MTVSIERRAKLSLMEFEAAYASRSRPVFLTDATDHWPARSKWSFDFFESRFGSKQVRFDKKTWEVGPFIRELKAGTGTGRTPYLKEVKLDEQFPELRDDIRDVALARNNRLASKLLPRSMRIDRGHVAVFVGTKGSGFRTLHWDYSYLHVFISQIVGDKEVILFRNEDAPYLSVSAENENLSTLPDPFDVDLGRFPEFRHASPTRITVKQGETLFLPGGWWHATYIEHPNIAIAESTLDHHNWKQRADWYLAQYQRDGVSAPKRTALGLYMEVADRLLQIHERRRGAAPAQV